MFDSGLTNSDNSSPFTHDWQVFSNHHNEYYSCVVPNVHSFNKKNRKSIQYPSLPSSVRPTLYDQHIPAPIFKVLLEEDNYESPTGSPSYEEFKINDKEINFIVHRATMF